MGSSSRFSTSETEFPISFSFINACKLSLSPILNTPPHFFLRLSRSIRSCSPNEGTTDVEYFSRSLLFLCASLFANSAQFLHLIIIPLVLSKVSTKIKKNLLKFNEHIQYQINYFIFLPLA